MGRRACSVWHGSPFSHGFAVEANRAFLLASMRIRPSRQLRVARVAHSAITRAPSSVDDSTTHFLEHNGWFKSWNTDGTMNIRCPWEQDHTTGDKDDKDDSSTKYFPAGVGKKADGELFAVGHFKCLHAHCVGRRDHDFLEAMGVVASEFEDLSMAGELVMLDGTVALPIVDLANISASVPTTAAAQLPLPGDVVAFPAPFPGAMAAAVEAALASAPKPQAAFLAAPGHGSCAPGASTASRSYTCTTAHSAVGSATTCGTNASPKTRSTEPGGHRPRLSASWDNAGGARRACTSPLTSA